MTAVARRDLSQTAARELVDGIRADVAGLAQRLTDAYVGRAWVALGYPTWALMCEHEFGGVPKLPIAERREAVTQMASAGMSTRAIGAGLGVHKDTVRNDLGGEKSPPANVIGLDGKRYTPPAPPPPRPAPVVDELAAVRLFWRSTRYALGLPAPTVEDLAAVATIAELEMTRYALRDLQDVLTQALTKEPPNAQA